jgi:hypothetical protein
MKRTKTMTSNANAKKDDIRITAPVRKVFSIKRMKKECIVKCLPLIGI